MKESRHFRYPFVSRAEKLALFKLATLWQLRSRTCLSPSPSLRQSKFRDITLIPIKAAPPPPSEAMILIVTCYNSMHEIAKFFKHYRRLGVDRFVVIDDGSDDGTRDYVASQDDSDLFASNVPFGGGRDRIWRQQVIERYGRDRWYLSVDSDEYLIFEDSETTCLSHLIKSLTKRREWHLAALMLDLYPDGPVDTAKDSPDRAPWQICPLFDSAGYFIRPQLRAMSIRGGPRYRHFGFSGRINKYPLFYADGSTSFDLNYHSMFPYHRSFVPVRGVLLHNKYAPGARKRLTDLAKRGRHNGSDTGPLIAEDFRNSGSTTYESSRQLLELGLVEPSL